MNTNSKKFITTKKTSQDEVLNSLKRKEEKRVQQGLFDTSFFFQTGFFLLQNQNSLNVSAKIAIAAAVVKSPKILSRCYPCLQ
jgi:hypothetical protein